MIRNLLNKWLGYKWSLYVTTNERELRYVVNADSPIPMLGYLIPSFEKYGNPKEPWRIWLNYNKNHTAIPITKDCFAKNGSVGSELLSKIKTLDPDFMRSAGNHKILTAEDCVNKRNIPFMSDHASGLDNRDRNNFLSIIHDIFKK